ncbi:MAG: hypothetical protein FWD02_04185 [Bacteroidales bacterium]|nr:hypothetical protein [Bacteroidales bacterium]
MKRPIVITLFLLLALKTNAQSIDNLLTAPWFGLSGGVSAQTVFSTGINEPHLTPFTYLISGNLSPVIRGFAVPLSFSYSNQRVNYSYVNPFNRFELAPSFRWVKLYIGRASMSFSPNTFNGQQFDGFGAELTPDGPFRISFMYGQLRRARLADSASNREASFRRMGFGSQMSYTLNQHVFGFTFFKAKDDPNSLERLIAQTESTQPITVSAKENLVTEFSYNGTLSPNLNVSAVYALSQFNHDHTALSQRPRGVIPFLTSFMMSNNAATSTYRSFRLGLNYRWIGVAYERIDPGYQSLGTFFSNNDMENFTINANHQFSSFGIGGNFGVQRNDLLNVKETSALRFVWAINTNWQTTEQISMTANYSNFTSFTNIRPISELYQNNPFDYVDTLSFSQISQSADFSLNWNIDRQNISYMFSFQDARDVRYEGVLQGMRIFSQSLNYSTTLASENTYTFGLSSTIQQIADGQSHLIGLIVSQSTSVHQNQIRIRNSFSYNFEISRQNPSIHIFNLRTTATYTYRNNHNFSASIIQQARFLQNARNRYSLVFSLSYAYNF